MTICINSSGRIAIDEVKGLALPLSASLSSEVDSIVSELETSGKLPTDLPAPLVEKMKESLTRYFGRISSQKIQQFTDKAREIIEAELKTHEEPADTGEGTVERGLGVTQGRSKLTDFVNETVGGDLGAVMNMDFFLKVAREVTQGGMSFVAQNWDQTRVDEYPALELQRVYSVFVPRGEEIVHGVPNVENGWDYRWPAACEESGDEDASKVFEETGRMVALKSSDVWQALGDGAGGYTDTLGNPFAPFAFNSGFDTEEVSGKEAVELGLIDPGEKAEPADVDFDNLFKLPDAVEMEAMAASYQKALKAGAPLGNKNASKYTLESANEITEKLIRETGRKDASDLMHGHCDSWAREIKEKHPEAEIVETDPYSKYNREGKAPSHTFIKIGRKYFDAESPEGVSDPRELKFFNGFKGRLDLHKRGVPGTTHIKFNKISSSLHAALAAGGPGSGRHVGLPSFGACLTTGNPNECYENARKEYWAQKEAGKFPKYMQGTVYGWQNSSSHTGGNKYAGQADDLSKEASPLHHAWVEEGGRIYDATPFKHGEGDYKNLPSRTAEAPWRCPGCPCRNLSRADRHGRSDPDLYGRSVAQSSDRTRPGTRGSADPGHRRTGSRCRRRLVCSSHRCARTGCRG